jgi:hypothetical protein
LEPYEMIEFLVWLILADFGYIGRFWQNFETFSHTNSHTTASVKPPEFLFNVRRRERI